MTLAELRFYVPTITHPCGILLLAQARPKMPCTYTSYLLRKLHKCAPPTSLPILEALPYSEGRPFTLAPNTRQGKRFSCVLVCQRSVFTRAACKETSKIGLELKILRSEAHSLRLKQLNP